MGAPSAVQVHQAADGAGDSCAIVQRVTGELCRRTSRLSCRAGNQAPVDTSPRRMPPTRSSRILPRIPKLPPRYAAIVMPLLLSLLMTAVVSLISTLKATGMPPDLATRWLSAWALSWLVAFPVLLVALPVVRRLTAMLVRPA